MRYVNIYMERQYKDEWRMYGLVPYNISPIQQGIQFGHAVVEYGLEHNDKDYQDWARDNKTFIILNGGTTNYNADKPGTLNSAHVHLLNLEMRCSMFFEPDLGDQLTAIVFLVPSQVYNKKEFPDYDEWLQINVPIQLDDEEFDIKCMEMYREFMGGQKNIDLRRFLEQFRLA